MFFWSSSCGCRQRFMEKGFFCWSCFFRPQALILVLFLDLSFGIVLCLFACGKWFSQKFVTVGEREVSSRTLTETNRFLLVLKAYREWEGQSFASSMGSDSHSLCMQLVGTVLWCPCLAASSSPLNGRSSSLCLFIFAALLVWWMFCSTFFFPYISSWWIWSSFCVQRCLTIEFLLTASGFFSFSACCGTMVKMSSGWWNRVWGFEFCLAGLLFGLGCSMALDCLFFELYLCEPTHVGLAHFLMNELYPSTTK